MSLELFASDLHLHPSRPGVTALFLSFLRGPARQARSLTLLGDLFDAWAGDDDLPAPLNTQICTELRALGEHGTQVRFMAGNRDFLIGAGFASASALTCIDDPYRTDVAGIPTLLLHGDTLCTDDTGYQVFRREVRTEAWRSAFLARPLAERKAIINGLRERSEAEKQIKPMDLMDANPAAISATFHQHGVSRMIHGHTHREAQHHHHVDGRDCQRWVLGDWHEGLAPYLECGPSGWHFRRWQAQ